MKEILELIPPNLLFAFSSFLLTALTAITGAVVYFARKTIVSEVKNFISKVKSIEADVSELKKAMLAHRISLESIHRDIHNEVTLTHDSIVATFTGARNQAFDRIREMQSLTHEIQVETAALGEVFRANSDGLKMKLEALLESKKEDTGKIKLLETKVERVESNFGKVIHRLDENGYLKKKAK